MIILDFSLNIYENIKQAKIKWKKPLTELLPLPISTLFSTLKCFRVLLI